MATGELGDPLPPPGEPTRPIAPPQTHLRGLRHRCVGRLPSGNWPAARGRAGPQLGAVRAVTELPARPCFWPRERGTCSGSHWLHAPGAGCRASSPPRCSAALPTPRVPPSAHSRGAGRVAGLGLARSPNFDRHGQQLWSEEVGSLPLLSAKEIADPSRSDGCARCRFQTRLRVWFPHPQQVGGAWCRGPRENVL